MASSDDDTDLKLAIALSLQGQQTREVVDLIDDENERTRSVVDGITKQSLPPSNLSFLGLNRKKMEEERLTRRRRLSLSPPATRKRGKVDLGDRESVQQPTGTVEHSLMLASDPPSLDRQPLDLRPLSRRTMDRCSPERYSLDRQSPKRPSLNLPLSHRLPYVHQDSSGPVFLEPSVKQTWAFGHRRTSSDVKLEEILQKNDLNLAVLSSFQWDMDWLLAKIDTNKTLITLVMQAKEQSTKEQYRRETAGMRNLRLCFPSMEGQVNCMHSKLMLLSYPTHLRVVVPTANLVPYDWGESGDMENSVFLVDVPRLSVGQRVELSDLTIFGRELVYFLKAKGLEASIIDSICNFDFAATKDIAFVHTIGGAHVGEAWQRTGYCGLGKAVDELGLGTDKALNMDFVTSSVGSLNIDFLSTLYLAAQGDNGLTEYSWRNASTGKSNNIRHRSKSVGQPTSNRQRIKDEVINGFRVYFPTQDTVKKSTAGYAGTICFQSKWYNLPTFPQQILRDCKSARDGLLMHNKIIYVRPRDKEQANGTCWAYVGSANCSESAWGRLSKSRTSKSPKLNCRNWECGVVIPVRQKGKIDIQDGLTCFSDIVPVPMQYPGSPYGNRKPWYYSEQ